MKASEIYASLQNGELENDCKDNKDVIILIQDAQEGDDAQFCGVIDGDLDRLSSMIVFAMLRDKSFRRVMSGASSKLGFYLKSKDIENKSSE